MSDKRTIYVLGTIIAGLAVVLAVGNAIPNIADITSTDTKAFGLMGHVTIVAENPLTGETWYIQTDNTIMNEGLNVAGAQLFNDTAAAPFAIIAVSSAAAGAATDALDFGTLTATNTEMALTETAYTHLDDVTATTAGQCGNINTETCEQIVQGPFTAKDTGTITSALLLDKNGKAISWVTVNPSIPITTDVTVVTITYQIALTG